MKRPLKELFFDYCKERGLLLEKTTLSNMDFTIKNGNDSIGVIIKDWNRAIGVDVVIQADRIKDSVRHISKMLIVTNTYSEPSVALANHISILVINRRNLQVKNHEKSF